MRDIIVIGYARSGTSYVAGVLNHLGVDMGDNWRKEDEANEAGYFENSKFVKANQLLLEHGKNPNLSKLDKYRKELWGAKDPRFLYTFDRYEFENPHFVIVMRNPVSIAKSVCHRDNGKHSPRKEFEEVIWDILKYYGDLERVKDYPHFFYSFENRPDEELAEFVGVEWKEHNLYQPELKHF